MMVTLHDGPFWTFVLEAETSLSRLVQSDWDFPLVASAFGWQSCSCGETDGTIDCEHRTANEMIWEAYDFLTAHVGKTIEDPGYF